MALSSTPRAEGGLALAFSSSTSSTKWAFQTVTVQGGAYFSLSAQALISGPGTEAVFLRLSWYSSADGTGPALDSVDSTATLASEETRFQPLTTGPVRAPVSARSARVRLMLRPASAAPATVYFDAVTFLEVEAPSSPSPTSTPTDRPTLAASPTPAGTPTPASTPSPAGTAGGSSESSPTPTAGSVDDAVPDPPDLANVRTTTPLPADTGTTGGGRRYGWAVALAMTIPLATVAAAAGYERWRRLAGGGGENL